MDRTESLKPAADDSILARAAVILPGLVDELKRDNDESEDTLSCGCVIRLDGRRYVTGLVHDCGGHTKVRDGMDADLERHSAKHGTGVRPAWD